MFLSVIKTLGVETTAMSDEASVPSSSCLVITLAVSSEYYTVSGEITDSQKG